MTEDLTIQLTPAMMALVPVVALVLQVIKKVPALEQLKDWMPFVSIGVALGLGYLTKMPDPVMPSILIGIAASGTYSLAKSTVKKR